MHESFDTEFEYEPAIGPEAGVSRRDPSDVIEVDGTYYVWYTRIEESAASFPGGYDGTVWYATSPDGHGWTEQGEALPAGGPGAWDENGVFTPDILASSGRYYLFYTAVPAPFEGDYPDATPTAIGVALADSPDGPWERFGDNPVLEPGPTGTWDDFRVDDSCVLERDGEVWLYYKGVTMFAENWYTYTPMGVATAEEPTGPYERSPYNPLVQPGHEICVWPHGDGVAALVTARNQDAELGHGVWYSDDGLTFDRKSVPTDLPRAPSVFRDSAERGVRWGICHEDREDSPPYLERFDCDLAPE